jgi:hypothetical protein
MSLSNNFSKMEQEPLSDVQKLIRLKRFENPPEGSVDDFLVEFQRRQRSQALTGSSTKLFFERLSTFMSGFGKQKWAFAAAGAYACVMLFFLVRPSVTPMGQQPSGSGGSANPVGGRGKVINQSPAYDPKANRVRPLPTKVPEVIVF